jgi:hypothetical protein
MSRLALMLLLLLGAVTGALLLGLTVYQADLLAYRRDFPAFYTVSAVLLEGTLPLSALYDPGTFAEAMNDQVPEAQTYELFWLYPPITSAVFLPLALLPFEAAYIAWVLFNSACVALAARILGARPAYALAFGLLPLVAINANAAQTGGLVTLLFALSVKLLLNGKREKTAGLVLSLLIIKPHLAALVPLFLVATKQYKTALYFCLSCAALLLFSLLFFSFDDWQAFLQSAGLASQKLRGGFWEWRHPISFYAAARALGASDWVALVSAAGLAVCVFLIAILVWRRERDPGRRSMGIALLSLFATIYSWPTDALILSVPLVLLLSDTPRNMRLLIAGLLTLILGATLNIFLGRHFGLSAMFPFLAALLCLFVYESLREPWISRRSAHLEGSE